MRLRTTIARAVLSASVLGLCGPFAALAGHEVKCKMTFNLKGWSAFYKTSSGHGTITCDN